MAVTLASFEEKRDRFGGKSWLLGCVSCQDSWVETPPCFVPLTRFQACQCGGGTSLFGREVSYQTFSRAVDFFFPFFFYNREKHKVLNCISFSWLQLPGQNWLYKWLFQRCQRHLAKKVPGAIGTGAVEKNKRLDGEERGSGKKKKRRRKKSRKSKGNWREKNVGRGKMRGEESAPRQILAK